MNGREKMEDKIIDGGCAFPNKEEVSGIYDNRFIDHKCMTLRDYFAGQALVGILSSLPSDSRCGMADIVNEAYWYAEGMIERRGAK